VKPAVIDSQLPIAGLSIDLNETMAEKDIAPSVILLCLHGRGNNGIGANDGSDEQSALRFE
jgi:hypothetical protein